MRILLHRFVLFIIVGTLHSLSIFYFLVLGFSIPYVLLSAFVKTSNPRAFRKLLFIPPIVAFHCLTYISKDLEQCRREEEQEKKL